MQVQAWARGRDSSHQAAAGTLADLWVMPCPGHIWVLLQKDEGQWKTFLETCDSLCYFKTSPVCREAVLVAPVSILHS